MKLRKILAIIAAMAVTASALAVSAFADIDYTAEAEANKGLSFDAIAGWAGGQWIVGNDKTCMDTPLTLDDLAAADHFEIAYTSTDIPPTLTEGDVAKLTFCFKFATSELNDTGLPDTMLAWLPNNWYEYGPNEDQGTGFSYYSNDVYLTEAKPEGVLIVPTADILAAVEASGHKDEVLYMWQFGIGCNAYDYDSDWTDEAELADHYVITISSVKLCDEPAETTAEETTTVEETTVAETTTVTEAATVAEETTTTAAAVSGLFGISGFVWMWIAIAAAVVIVIVVVVVIVVKKKK